RADTTGPTVDRITNFLVKEGFLRPTPGYKARGFMQKGLPKFRIPESEEIRQRIWHEIMNPWVKIGHHVGFFVHETSSRGAKCGSVCKTRTPRLPRSARYTI